MTTSITPHAWTFETITVHVDGPFLFAEILAPPMNLLGPELVRDLVSLIQRAEADNAYKVLVFKSGDRDYYISHVDLTRIPEYRHVEPCRRALSMISSERSPSGSPDSPLPVWPRSRTTSTRSHLRRQTTSVAIRISSARKCRTRTPNGCTRTR